MSALFAFLLKLLGGNFLDRVLGHLERRAASENERLRIEGVRDVEFAHARAKVVVAGMGYKMFWVAWSPAALSMSLWFAWGMLDTISNGALPDVAVIPPGLLPWAQTVWDSVFYSGAGVASAQALGSALRRR